jgi:hypothetical protein
VRSEARVCADGCHLYVAWICQLGHRHSGRQQGGPQPREDILAAAAIILSDFCERQMFPACFSLRTQQMTHLCRWQRIHRRNFARTAGFNLDRRLRVLLRQWLKQFQKGLQFLVGQLVRSTKELSRVDLTPYELVQQSRCAVRHIVGLWFRSNCFRPAEAEA